MKAEKLNKKLISSSLSKKDNKTIAFAYLNQAYIHSMLSYPVQNWEEDIYKAKEAISLVEEREIDLSEFTSFNSQIIETYYEYGNLYKANLLLDSVENKLGSEFDVTHIEYHMIKARVYSSLGRYHLAMREAKEVYKSLLETAPHSKDNYDYFRSLIKAKHLVVYILLEAGNYYEALKKVDETASYILTHLKKRDVSYINNQILKGNILVASEKYQEATEVLDKVYDNYIDRSFHGYNYKTTNPRYLEFIEITAKAHWYNNTKEGAREVYNHIEPQIKRYYEDSTHHIAWFFVLKGDKFFIQHDYEKALEQYLSEWKNYDRLSKTHPVRISLGLKILTCYYNTKNYKEVISFVPELNKIVETNTPKESPTYHSTILKEAKYLSFISTESLDSLKHYYESGLDSIKSNGIFNGSPTYTTFLNDKAFFLVELNDLKGAEELCLKTTKTVKNIFGTDHYRYGQQMTELAKLYLLLGKPIKAYESALRGKNILENYKYKTLDRAAAYRVYASACINTGEYKEAERSLKKAQALSPNDGKKDIDEYSRLYIDNGEYTIVEKILLEKLDNKKSVFGPNSKKTLPVYNQLTELYITLGDFSLAHDYNQTSLELSKELYSTNSRQYTEALKLSGDLHASVGDYEAAIEDFKEAYETEVNLYGEKNVISAQTFIKLNLCKFHNNRDERNIETNIQKGVDIITNSFKDEKYTPLVAKVLTQQAIYQIEIDKLDEAEQNLNTANKIWIEYLKLKKGNKNSARIYYLKGILEQYRGDYKSALTHYNESSTIYERLFGENHPDYVHTLTKIGQIQYILGEKDDALKTTAKSTVLNLKLIDEYFPILSERAKAQFWSIHKIDFEFYNTLVLEDAENNINELGKIYDNTLATKALLLSNSIKLKQNILSSGDTTLIELFEQYQELREKLAYSLSSHGNEQEKHKKLERQIADIEKELSSKSESFSSLSQKKRPTWKDIQSKLKENETAIEIIRYRHFEKEFTDSIIYAALIINSDTKKQPKVVILPNGKELESTQLTFYQNSIKYRFMSNKSFNAYWAPIDQHLTKGSDIYLSSEGVYNQINIETFSRDEKEYLLQSYNINLITSTKDILEKNSGFDQSSVAALFANPSYYKGNDDNHDHLNSTKSQRVPQLKGAEQEVNSIQNILNTEGVKNQSFVFSTATEDTLKQLESPSFVHIASHGYFIDDQVTSNLSEFDDFKVVENPLLKSGILLAHGGDILETEEYYNYNKTDGILTALEAINLNLNNTDFVVLSACETGLGEIKNGEGVYGLQRALQIAGAQTVIMSLFKVDDQVTNKLMQLFYKQYLKTKDKKSSFLYAKKELMKTYESPIYWGAFILIE